MSKPMQRPSSGDDALPRTMLVPSRSMRCAVMTALFRYFLLAFIAATPGAAAAQPLEPVNERASPEARTLLRYLYEIDEAHTLSGQHNYNGDLNQFTDRVEALTGARPALWGTDFIWRGTEDPGLEIVAEAIRKHEQGYLVTLMWHAGRPTDTPPFGWSESIQGELTGAEWRELVTPGSALHTRWLAQIDTVATYLQALRDAGIPVLWRPYHEMNGVWFWWGDKRGPDGFQKLWRMMFDRYVNYHDLTNLIWVWNANAPRDIPQDEAYDYTLYYPGPDYVDVLATDVYHFDYEQSEYEELLGLANGKPIALGEVGQLPKPEILEAQPMWAWFMVWSQWLETHNTLERVQRVYAHPATLTHDELDLYE